MESNIDGVFVALIECPEGPLLCVLGRCGLGCRQLQSSRCVLDMFLADLLCTVPFLFI